MDYTCLSPPTSSSVPIVVISKVVDTVLQIANNTLRSDLLDLCSDLSRGAASIVLQTNKIGGDACDVRAGHAGSRNSFGGSVIADPGGKDVDTRSEDVKSGAPVREVGSTVIPVGCADGDDFWGRGRGDGRYVDVFVSGGGDDNNSPSYDGGGGFVEGFRVSRT